MKSRIVLLGPPAAGKGTQARLLSNHCHLPMISTGDVLRAEQKRDSALGREATRYLSKGHYVPDALIIDVVEGWIQEHGDQFVLDGFPRTVAQGEKFDDMLGSKGIAVDVALFLDAPRSLVMERVEQRVYCLDCKSVLRFGQGVKTLEDACPDCGARDLEKRYDDGAYMAGQRLEEYLTKTAPLVPFYNAQLKLRRIDATQSTSQVFDKILATLESL